MPTVKHANLVQRPLFVFYFQAKALKLVTTPYMSAEVTVNVIVRVVPEDVAVTFTVAVPGPAVTGNSTPAAPALITSDNFAGFRSYPSPCTPTNMLEISLNTIDNVILSPTFAVLLLPPHIAPKPEKSIATFIL